MQLIQIDASEVVIRMLLMASAQVLPNTAARRGSKSIWKLESGGYDSLFFFYVHSLVWSRCFGIVLCRNGQKSIAHRAQFSSSFKLV